MKNVLSRLPGKRPVECVASNTLYQERSIENVSSKNNVFTTSRQKSTLLINAG